MNNSHARTLPLLLFTLPFVLHATDVAVVRGQLHAHGQRFFQGLLVDMEDSVSHTQIHRVDVSLDGAFEFRGVPTGDYVLHVTNLLGQQVHQQLTSIHEHTNEVSVFLADAGRMDSKPGTVSVTQLMHPPDKKAVQAFHTATRLSETGKYDQAIEALEKAVRISPEFGQAYTNLAVQHIRMRQYEQSMAESKRAMQIGGPDAVNLCNLSFAQYQLRRVADAEASARAALRLDSGYLQGHMLLGTILSNNPATRAEAIEHLELAATRFPSAQHTLDVLRATH